MHRPLFSLFVAAFLAAPALTQNRTWYVDATRPGPGTGTANDPFSTIGAGVAAAGFGDRVLVAPGIYPESVDLGVKDLLVESSGGAAVTRIGGGACLGQAIVVATPSPAGTALRGFTLENGCVGLVCVAAPGSFALRECVVTRNTRGGVHLVGAILNVAPRVVLSDCRIQDNTQEDLSGESFGAGLRVAGPFDVLVERTVFSANRAGTLPNSIGVGGAVWLFGVRATPTWPAGVPRPRAVFHGCDFLDNLVRSDASRAVGGAVSAHHSECVFTDCRFERNAVDSTHFVAVALGGALHAEGDSAIEIDGAVFAQNLATATAAAGPFPGLGVAEAGGGALSFLGGVVVRARDVELRGNTVSASGPTSARASGAALRAATGGSLWGDAVLEFEHATSAANGGPEAFAIEESASLAMSNSILWEPAAAALASSTSSTVDLRFCDVSGGWPGMGNLAVDPIFRSLASGDLRLNASSPCVDAAPPTTSAPELDLGSFPRPLDGDLDGIARADLGAHEFAQVELEVLGSLAPNAILDFRNRGPVGTPYLRLLALPAPPIALPAFGPLFLDPLQPWIALHTGTVPDQRLLTVPSAVPLPAVLLVQDLVYFVARNTGSCSNPVFLAR